MPGLPASRGAGGSYRWTVLAVGSLAQAAASAYVLGLAAIGPALRAGYGLSLPGLGLLLAASTAGLLLTVIAWGRASDRLGERAVMAAGLVVAAAALAIAPLMRRPVPLGLVLVLAGAGAASVNAASGRAVLTWFGPARRGLAMGVRQTAVPVGAGLGAVVLPPITRAHGLAAAYLTLAAFSLVAAVAVWAWIREPAAVPGPQPPTNAPSGVPPKPAGTGAVLRDPVLVRLALGSALLVIPQFVIVAFSVELLHERGGLSPGAAAVVLAVAQGTGGAGRLLAGWWSDRVGSRLQPLRLIAITVAAGFAGLAGAVFAPVAVLVVGLVAVAGVVISWNGLAFTAAGELAPPGRAGTALGAQNSACFVSATLTPPAIGAVITVVGWPVALLLAALPAVAAARLFTPLLRAERRAGQQVRPSAGQPAGQPAQPPVGQPAQLARSRDSSRSGPV